MANQQLPQAPPYAPEYDKPPPYFEQPTGAETTVLVGAPQPGQPGGYNPGWQAPPQHYPPQQFQPPRPTVVTVHTHTGPAYVQPMPVQQTRVVLMGNCPSCRIGNLQSQFDICGVLIAILFFPIGILCCLCMMEKRCSHCRARF
ncbi:unnamed protein product [Orchesella dallaii]|uniref:Membrane protein BRI3 n=1 Tax=Orchesella dallaii TaxID=48710 RepID=A0ABP1S6C5_9HEXA